MKQRLLEWLVCPDCDESLRLESVSEAQGEVESGELVCNKKGCTYPILKFIPRFVDSSQYAESFSDQRVYVRKHFEHYKRDRSGYRLFNSTTDFSDSQLKEGLNLEVGCGYGRFLDVVEQKGGEVVGIDLSTISIELAQDFVGSRLNVHLVQCDAFKLPFRKKMFRNIYSIGVLHHTPDAKKAFARLPNLLKDGGQISIWVYPPEMKVSDDRLRLITKHIPSKAMYFYCIANQGLFSWLRKIPKVGYRFNQIIPGCEPTPGHHFWLRVMSDFDSFTPKFATTHSTEEVKSWFEEAELRDIRILSRRTSVTATRA